jgi:hypothetical protein
MLPNLPPLDPPIPDLITPIPVIESRALFLSGNGYEKYAIFNKPKRTGKALILI